MQGITTKYGYPTMRATAVWDELGPNAGLSSPSESLIEAVGQRLQILSIEISIYVQCHGCTLVTEHALDGFDIGATGDGKRRGGVAQIVNAQASEFGSGSLRELADLDSA